MSRLFPTALCLFVFLVLPVGPAAADSAIVPFDPQTVAVPDALDDDRAVRAVLEAFVIRGWRITRINREQGHIDAELPVRAHVGRVRARIVDAAVVFAYRDSENIDHGWFTKKQGYSKGDSGETYFTRTRETDSDIEAVHRNYLSWVNELARTIEGTFMLAELEAD